jgi:chromate transporter
VEARTVNALLFGPLGPSTSDFLSLFLHFAVLSLLAIGGAVTTVPDMHRYVVGQRGWLDDATFSGSVALAQAAPGPNVLFVAVIGFNVGGFAGVATTLVGALLPSTLLTLAAARWSDGRRDQRGVRAFTEGMAPVTIGLLLATSWILTEPTRTSPVGWLLFGATAVWMVRTKWSPLWPIAAGAVAGALGWV